MANISRRNSVQRTLNDFYHKPIAQVSLELFLTVGAVIFFAVFAIRPTIVTISELQAEIEDKQELDEDLSAKITALSSVQQQYLNLQDRLPILDDALPNQANLRRTVKVIERLASEQQLVIETMRVPEIPPEVPIDVANTDPEDLQRIGFPVVITVAGDYTSIRNFVEAMRQIRRSVLIDTITFAIQEEKGQRQLSATINVSVQFFTTEAVAQQLSEDDS